MTASNLRAAEREDALDSKLLTDAARSNASGDYLPARLVKRMLGGEHPVRIWREHRGMTAGALATAAGVAPAYLSEIETGKKPGAVKALRALARVLEVAVDDLVP
jgi:DNA-binding XRE family transcriptional regulator